MKPRKLSDDKIDELKGMLLEGLTPEDASRHFQVAVSSIHNYKKILKEQGIELPNVRGQRPQKIILPEQESVKTVNLEEDFLKIDCKGVNVYVKNTAKSIIVNENSISIEF